MHTNWHKNAPLLGCSAGHSPQYCGSTATECGAHGEELTCLSSTQHMPPSQHVWDCQYLCAEEHSASHGVAGTSCQATPHLSDSGAGEPDTPQSIHHILSQVELRETLSSSALQCRVLGQRRKDRPLVTASL